MITAAGDTGRGEQLLYLGLSAENLSRLKDGKPILLNSDRLTQLGLPPMVVIINYGETEDAIVQQLRDHGVTVGVKIDERPG